MKRFLTVLTALVVAVGALVQCKPYDDAWIKEELAELKAQVANLQNSVNALDAYKTLLDKSRLISEVKDHGNGTFTIYFADGTAPVTLIAGQGPKGEASRPTSRSRTASGSSPMTGARPGTKSAPPPAARLSSRA